MPKPVGSYVYWSERLVGEVIDDNGVRLDPRIKSALKLGVAGSGLDLTGRDREKTSFEIAEKLKKKLRSHMVSDLDTPGPLRLVQGEGWVEVAEFQRWDAGLEHTLGQRTAVIHAQTVTQEGRRVDICLFGSLKNLRGYTILEEDPGSGWVSSAAPAIQEFIALRGAAPSARTRDTWGYDEEAVAVEALKVALFQGISNEYTRRPEARAFTVMDFKASEYVAVIYKDVTLTPDRWDHEPDMNGVSRILIGAPLWLRMTRPETMRTYSGTNRGALPGRDTSRPGRDDQLHG
ncbi:hypothetical protein ACIQVA_20130 [Streptomyces microflavus]|uniref:hypothetical protein n=1 Tax=Streptomyces microflavus TaxID=1919 RepID=UPI003824A8BB